MKERFVEGKEGSKCKGRFRVGLLQGSYCYPQDEIGQCGIVGKSCTLDWCSKFCDGKVVLAAEAINANLTCGHSR